MNHIAYNAELLFDFAKQLILKDSIPSYDVIPLKNSIALRDSVPNFDGSILDSNSLKSAQSQSNETYHLVIKNDTLYNLARHYGTTVNNICAINQIDPSAILKIGQRVKVR